MGISSQKKESWERINPENKERIVQMAWEDRSAFDDISKQFQISVNDIERFMRTQLNEKDYKRWRKRANTQGSLKHRKIRNPEVERFKCSRQRMDGSTKGWK